MHAEEIARFFLARDPKEKMFGNDRNGNIRLNLYLQLAQNLNIAKTGEKLFEEDLEAREFGGIVPSVWEKYSILRSETLAKGAENNAAC